MVRQSLLRIHRTNYFGEQTTALHKALNFSIAGMYHSFPHSTLLPRVLLAPKTDLTAELGTILDVSSQAHCGETAAIVFS